MSTVVEDVLAEGEEEGEEWEEEDDGEEEGEEVEGGGDVGDRMSDFVEGRVAFPRLGAGSY